MCLPTSLLRSTCPYPSLVCSRFQLSVWVADVDAVCAQLRERGVVLNGPVDRPWGMRTANFVDPAGHGWEVGQRGVVPK